MMPKRSLDTRASTFRDMNKDALVCVADHGGRTLLARSAHDNQRGFENQAYIPPERHGVDIVEVHATTFTKVLGLIL